METMDHGAHDIFDQLLRRLRLADWRRSSDEQVHPIIFRLSDKILKI